MEKKDITTEEWREYEFAEGGTLPYRTYRIVSPVALYVGETTHRVVDASGVTHCVPAPGVNGCVLRWKANPPVSF